MGAKAAIVAFEIEGRRYGVPAGDVVELLRAVASTPLPAAPPVIEGVVNVRGTLIPLLDLRYRFQLPRREARPSDHIIVARAGDRQVGWRCDQAIGLVETDADRLLASELLAPGLRYLAALAPLPDGVLLIDDVATFLTRSEQAALEASLPSPREAS